jgi:hypothetical protein
MKIIITKFFYLSIKNKRKWKYRFYIICLLLSLGFSQSPSQIYFMELDSSVIQDSLSALLRNNFDDFHEYRLKQFSLHDSIKAFYALRPIEARIDTLIFSNHFDISPQYLHHIFSLKTENTIGQNVVNERLRNIQKLYPFILEIPNYRFGRISEEKMGLQIDFSPEFQNYFSALVGANQGIDLGWDVTGEIEMHFENTFHRTETIGFHWQKLDSLSQNLRFEYEDPFPFGQPIGINLSYERNVINGHFSEISSQLGLSINTTILGQISLAVESSDIFATAQGKDLGFMSNHSKSMVAKISAQNLNHRWLPSKGFNYYLEGKIGNLQDGLSYGLSFKGKTILPVRGKWISTFQLWGEKFAIKNSEVPESRKIRFGGLETLKGFREDEFLSDWVVIPEMKLSYILSEDLHFISFIQSGWFHDASSPKSSYGFGISQINKNAVIEIHYGLEMASLFSDGNIHIRYSSRF